MNQSTSFYQIKDFAKVKGGKRLPQGFLVQDTKTDHPYIRVTDMRNDGLNVSDIKYLPEGVYEKISKYTISNDDIYISNAGTVGLTGKIPDYLSGANLTENSAKVTELDTDLINQDYLIYFLRSREGQFQIKSRVGGSSQPKLALNKIETIEVPRLPISQQSQIATILSNYDDLIVNNEKRIKILEEMAQRFYTEWFVRFKFPGYEEVKMIDSRTEFGMVPEGWLVEKIKDLYKTSSGGTPSRKNETEFYESGSIPWIKTKELNDKYILDTEEKISEIALKKSSAKLFPINTVLVAMYGATIGKLGILSEESTTNQACCAFLLKNDLFSSYYIFQFLKYNIKKLINLAFGGAQPNVSQNTIGNLLILKPLNDVLEVYNKKSEVLFKEILMLQKQTRNLSLIRNLLIPQLITGKRELKN